MDKRAATYRIPARTADRLAQAHYRTGKPKATIVAEALDHWLANPRSPGCPVVGMAKALDGVLAAVPAQRAAP